MSSKTTNNKPIPTKFDGHLLGFFRSTFRVGGGSSVTLFNKIYYSFTSPGSIDLTGTNPLGFSWASSQDAIFRIITISPGSNGQSALTPAAPSGPNSTGTGSGGESGTLKVLVSEPISPYGSSIPIVVGNVPGSGVGIGSTSGGDRGGGPSYPNTTPGFAGTSFATSTISPYTQYFDDYSFSSASGGGGNTTYYAGPAGLGGGGGGGGIAITSIGSPSPTKTVIPIPPVSASNGTPGGGPTPNGRVGGDGGSGGVGYGAGGGGGGGPVEDFGFLSPGGTGGAGASGIVLVVIEGNIPV